MHEALEDEVEPEARVQMQERVAVECRGHTERVVVSGVKPGLALLAVDADQQAAAGPALALGSHGLQKLERPARREVADARSRVEEGRAALIKHVVERQPRAEVRDHADHLDLGKIRRHARERPLDLGPRDVDRNVAHRVHERQPRLRLAAIASAQVHELASLAERLRDLGAVLAKQRHFRACGVVLRQPANRPV